MGIGDLVKVGRSPILGHYSGQLGTVIGRPDVDTFSVRMYDRAEGRLMINARESAARFHTDDLEVVASAMGNL